MKVNERKYPFLKFLSNNHLWVDNSMFSEMTDFPTGIDEARRILEHFQNKKIPIHYIAKTVHDKLHDTNNFIKAKPLLLSAPEMVGLLLLPEELMPNVVSKNDEWRPQELKMNCILFSFMEQATYDTLRYGERQIFKREDYADDEDYNWEVNQYKTGRWLHFLPIQLDKFFHVDNNSIAAVLDEFGESHDQYGRDINGNIIDYIWSFILFYNFTEADNKIIHGTDTEITITATINNEKFLNENSIEIIDATYFTKIIPAGGFGVNEHFKIHRFGPEDSQIEIIYNSTYKN